MALVPGEMAPVAGAMAPVLGETALVLGEAAFVPTELKPVPTPAVPMPVAPIEGELLPAFTVPVGNWVVFIVPVALGNAPSVVLTPAVGMFDEFEISEVAAVGSPLFAGSMAGNPLVVADVVPVDKLDDEAPVAPVAVPVVPWAKAESSIAVLPNPARRKEVVVFMANAKGCRSAAP
jgi:hypothetical protein